MRALTLTAVVLVGCNVGPPAAKPETVLVMVNGQPITLDDVAQQQASAAHQTVAPDNSAVLEAVVDQELAAQQAKALNLEPDAASQKEIASLEARLSQARRRGLAQAWYAKQAGGALVSEAEARQWFEAHRTELSREVRVTMVLKRSATEIAQIQTVAGSGVRLEQLGGRDDLGWLGWAQLPSQWREPLMTLKVGAVSAVIPGDHGRFWLLRLDEVRDVAPPSFEVALPQIRRLDLAERAVAEHQQEHQQLRSAAQVVYARKPSSVE